MADVRQIALLIDADNTQPQKMHAVVQMLSRRGQINVRRAYANWQKEALKSWSSVLETHGINQIQQADFVTGKNASDIALAIAAIDLLHKDRFGTFAIVSSDSDFTPLATHLREAGVQVIIFGKQQAVQAYRNSCHEFIFLEELEPISAKEKEAAEAAANPDTAPPAATSAQPNKQELFELLRIFAEKNGDADGYVSTCAVANHLRTLYPKFKIKGYGASSMTVFCRKHDKLYEVKKEGEGGNVIAYYRSIRPAAPAPEADPKAATKAAASPRQPRHDIPADTLHRALSAYAETHTNNLGYTYAPAAAVYIASLFPGKNTFGGYDKLLTFLEAHRAHYGVMKIPQGVACGIFYRCIGQSHSTPELPGLELG